MGSGRMTVNQEVTPFLPLLPVWPLLDRNGFSADFVYERKLVSMNARVAPLIALAAVVTMIVDAQSTEPPFAHGNQIREYWTDASTGLMWAGRDNGKDVSWKGAVKYCRDLRLAGYSNWRLATLAELGAIFDGKADAPGLAGLDKGPSTWHVKGNLFLTGDEWSSERRYDDRGHPSGYEWHFDFNEGRSDNQPSGFPYPHSLMRALCVRGSDK